MTIRYRCAAAALAAFAGLGSPTAMAQAPSRGPAVEPVAATVPAQNQPAPVATTQAEPASAATAAMSGDPAAGRAKTAMCAGCHEIPGWQTAFPEVYKVPRIIGQHEAYLVHALQAYRVGDRSHPSMRAIAASLSDKDMADLAAYYSQRTVKTAAQ